MDDFCSHIRRLVDWLNVAPVVPVTFAEPGFRRDLLTIAQPFLELYLVTEGQLRLTVKQHAETLRSGDLALANAHFGNTGQEAGGAFRYACVSIELPDEPRFAAWSRAPFLCTGKAPDAERAQQLFSEVAHVYHGPSHNYRDVQLKAVVLQLLVAVGDTGVAEGGGTQNPHVRRATEIMAERRNDPSLNLAQIARRVWVSPSHLVRVFQSTLGRSPMRHLTDVRIRHAQSLLLRSSLSVKEIAFMVGFRDQLYFSRVFSQQNGVSPRAFRLAQGKIPRRAR